MSRLVVVSNRVALPAGDGVLPAGGLAVAVNAALSSRRGLWLGWSGDLSETEPAGLRLVDQGNVLYALQDLSPTDHEMYYNGYCNRVLWPLFHYRLDLMKFDEDQLEAYMRVNRLFARRLADLIEPDDVIWVHDYHLIPLARILREQGVRNRIGFFLHIPCPSPDILASLPHHGDVIGALAAYDLVGFQTDADRENFDRYMDRFAPPHRPRTDVFPVSIETREFSAQAEEACHSEAVQEIRDSLGGGKLIIGVDRLDYSKGIANRLDAFEWLLEQHSEWEGQVTYLQIAPKSRSDVPEYAEMDRFISMKMGQVNGRFGSPSWTPLRYVNRNMSREALAGLYRVSDVALVTPFRDGMNLVAKEFLAAQEARDPGVLVLSEFAGAASELSLGSLMVNPYDIHAIGRAIDAALRMSRHERVRRFERLLPVLNGNDIETWSARFLDTLGSRDRASTGDVIVLREDRQPIRFAGPRLLEPAGGHAIRMEGE
jgi:trehalose 6-phosphate synthase